MMKEKKPKIYVCSISEERGVEAKNSKEAVEKFFSSLSLDRVYVKEVKVEKECPKCGEKMMATVIPERPIIATCEKCGSTYESGQIEFSEDERMI